MRTFTQYLELADKERIEAHKLLTAVAVRTQLDINEINLNEVEFESVCAFVYQWAINTKATPHEIAGWLIYVIEQSDIYTYRNMRYYESEIADEINNQI